MSKKNTFGEFLSEIASRIGVNSSEELRSLIKTQDYKYNCDFSITKALRENKADKDAIKKSAESISSSLKDLEFIEKTEVVNGYVNCWYNYKAIMNRLVGSMGEDYGSTDYGAKKRVLIEHTSVNPNKAIHIGHTRNSSIGDSLSRLLRLAGYDVIVTNYIDDTGAQVADNVVGIKFMGLPPRKEGVKIDHYLGDEVYITVNDAYAKDSSLMSKRSLVLKAIEAGDNDIALEAKEMVDEVLRAQLDTMSRLGVFYDLVNYESHILAYKFWEIAFEQLKKAGVIDLESEGEKKGCWVFQASNGDKKILTRSDGTVVYAGKDIAYAMWKHGLLNGDFRYKEWFTQKNGEELWATTLDKESETNHPMFNHVQRSISVIDIRQSYEQNVVKEAINKLSGGETVDYMHYDYAVVALSSNTAKKLGFNGADKGVMQMSGRKGVYINADDFIDKLKGVILEETKKKNTNDLSEEEYEKIAEDIAVSTLRYEMVRTDPKKTIVFDVDEAIKLESKGAIYIDYTLSRMAGILRNAAEDIQSPECPDNLDESEKKLLFNIFRFQDIVESAAKSLDLTIISNFVSEFASDFNAFYAKNQVIKAEGKRKTFRLWLVDSSRKVLKNAASILGVLPLERM
ncbi:MAG: arginine--tRNA ligase [Candidatus Parvarchaeota archaeon]|nr:arginine--tRNA ligase [Candidatus Parvarchaeota archaeon]